MFVVRVGDDALVPLAPTGNFASVEPDEPVMRSVAVFAGRAVRGVLHPT